MCTSRLKPLHTAFLYSIRIPGYKIGIKFDKDPSAVEQNNFTTKIINTYIVYDLDVWPRNLINNFKLKNCLFDATNIVKSSDKEKWVYSGYGIAFDVADSWNFDNDFARNVIIFGVDNSSSSHTDNRKSTFSVLDGGPTYSINRNFGSPEKMITVNLSNGYLLVNGKEIFKCKNKNVIKMLTFQLRFV